MRFSLGLGLVLILSMVVSGAETAGESPADEGVLAGHSYHGEAFNAGPRQAAEIIPGMAEIDFPTSSDSPTAQKFVEQGIAQLHGFWYLEAERSFRQASKEDPELAIAYWGMAMANINNKDRARGFIDEAMERRDDSASKREKLYIEALDRYIPKPPKENEKPKPSDKEREERKRRAERFVYDLEKLMHEYPDDLEARALLALRLWTSEREGVKLTSRYAVDALLGDVFDANPMHPAHHYRIHLWDSPRPSNALKSAALCGPSSAGIAHMWHMPGHIYSRLKRYGDAAWQQEASARVDHAHMIRTRLMPDEIHNFAHNNEWCVRNLIFIGRVQDALDLSRNLVSLPQHPRYNTLSKRGSYKYGRTRLLQTLSEYCLWEELIRESGGHYLPPTEDERQQEEWLGWLGVAQFMTADDKAANRTLRSLKRRLLVMEIQLLDVQDAATETASTEKNDAEKPDAEKPDAEEKDSEDQDEKEDLPSEGELKSHIKSINKVIARVSAAAAVKQKDLDAYRLHAKAASLNSLLQAQWLGELGEFDEGIKLAERAVSNGTNQVRPLAVLIDLLWRKDRKDDAKKHFETLRSVAAEADLDTPLLAKLEPVAKAAGIEGDWRIVAPPADDLGERPPLDELGPFRWQPYTSPSWGAATAGGDLVSGEEFDGKPRILIFYLGFGCLHCVEQLHEFAPRVDDFRQAGIEIVGISTENVEQLQTGIKNFDREMDMQLLSDSEQAVFRSFRCWDDFEDQPLHGTFLIDGRGRIRWQDISYEPFMDVDFLLKESKRLLELPSFDQPAG
ncbi:MAG: redoxin domain-containing protein [Rubripirellula sp.]|nr:redoxin domain-containing protein [Rubripirellula sp.]